ncbi:MAG: sterol desaturase family protein [Pseudomonadota bacterium]
MLIKSVLITLALVLVPLFERLRPAVTSPLLVTIGQHTRAGWRRLGRNAGLFALTSLMSLLVVAPVTAFGFGYDLGLRGDQWRGGAWLMLDVLILDCWIYWWHRANHELSFLWRFHRVHHLDQILDSSSALRFHFGEVVLSAFARLPMVVVFSIPLTHVAIFEALVLCGAIFHHSTLALPKGLERRLSRLIITPSIHWVHHHKVRRDTDSNYGTIFSFWDPLFRSRSATTRWREMPIGIEGEGADLPLQQLLQAPFRQQPERTPHHNRLDGS